MTLHSLEYAKFELMDFQLLTWCLSSMMAGSSGPLVPLSLSVCGKSLHACYKPEGTKMLHGSVETSLYVLEPGLAASHILIMV
jgi:hypothetical protein